MEGYQEVNEISLVDLMFYCLKRWRWIVVCMLLLAAAAGVYKYQAVIAENQVKREQKVQQSAVKPAEGETEIESEPIVFEDPASSAVTFAIVGMIGGGCLACMIFCLRYAVSGKLQDISNEQLEENILSIYAKLYHKYESDKQFIPEGNLIEVKFEDFEADAMSMTENIYKSLSIPGFAEARGDIEKYVGGKKGYKKNKYKYDDRTIQLVEENWDFALKQWDYNL